MRNEELRMKNGELESRKSGVGSKQMVPRERLESPTNIPPCVR